MSDHPSEEPDPGPFPPVPPAVRRVHLDSASSQPLHPAAVEVLLAAHEQGWADPDRLYTEARRSRAHLENAREIHAYALGCRPDELTFTTSHTQALHMGVLGLLAGRQAVSSTLVRSAVEHSAVIHAGELHERAGGQVVEVAVDRFGRVDVGAFVDALTSPQGSARPAAVGCVQAANHEVGTLQPVSAIAEFAAGLGVPLVVDVGQSAGREQTPEGWSALAANASAWCGPAGVGVLAVRTGVRFRSPLPDDEREGGRFPGVPDVARILTSAAALQASLAEAQAVGIRQRLLTEQLRRELPARIRGLDLVGHPTDRLPHIVTFSCLYVDGEALLGALDRSGFAVSSGSSCAAGTVAPSHVLQAMGALTHGNVRVSLSRTTTQADIAAFIAALPPIVAELRESVGASDL